MPHDGSEYQTEIQKKYASPFSPPSPQTHQHKTATVSVTHRSCRTCSLPSCVSLQNAPQRLVDETAENNKLERESNHLKLRITEALERLPPRSTLLRFALPHSHIVNGGDNPTRSPAVSRRGDTDEQATEKAELKRRLDVQRAVIKWQEAEIEHLTKTSEELSEKILQRKIGIGNVFDRRKEAFWPQLDYLRGPGGGGEGEVQDDIENEESCKFSY